MANFCVMALQARLEWEQKEREFLSPYAQMSCESRGREHTEPVHVFRSEYQRDRDRIVHSTAFRRLEYKTQVVLNGTGDHYRTRLTHTIEVAAIARSTARTLGLNEDLTEAISLAHDLGHAPFGQPGEHTLNQLMRDHGGFEHNRQSLRVVEHLEMKYPEFNGLNLSWEVRHGLWTGIRGHDSGTGQPSLEAQVADVADDIAYCCHDLDDALENQLLTAEDLEGIQLWKDVEAKINENYSRLEFDRKRKFIIRGMINALVEDICRTSAQNLQDAHPENAADVLSQSRRLVGFSMPMLAKVQNLRDFLLERFYYHPEVSEVNQRACRILQELFTFYHKHSHLIGEKAALRIKKDGIARAVCDYVSGMTDRYALEMYAKHIGTDELLNELLPPGREL